MAEINQTLNIFYGKELIYGIAYECPFTWISPFSFKEKYRLINGLKVEDKKAIVEHHEHCSYSRE